ncbi:MAG: hypothetical protein H7338_00595 [Candidatus Sericytochromatia bacterium]|nr:hypothetical protein [Candidatus Sericytochromatia bacterium]
MIRRLSVVALTLALLPAGAAVAHGGEDHGDHAPIAATTPNRPGLTRAAATDRFELVMTLEAPKAGSKQHVHLYLSDYATNAPVHGATLSLDWGQQVTGQVSETKQAGVYESEVSFPAAGDYAPLVTVNAGGEADLITLDAIPVPAPATPPVSKNLPWLVGVAVLLLAGGLAWWRWKPRAQRDVHKAEARS